MLDDPSFVSAQYQTTDPLQARIALHKRFSTNPILWYVWLYDRVPLDGQGRLLEVGCGPGDLWVENQDRLPDGWSFFLSDLHPSMVDQAQQRIGRRSCWVYMLADAQAIPFGSAEFDLVVANHMLYHTADPDQVLQDIARVLKPGGWFLTATNGPNHLLELRQLMSRFLPESWFAEDTGQEPAGLPSFNLENGNTWLRPHFTEIEASRHPTSLRVTEVEPLLDYIRSHFPGRIEADEEMIQPITEFLKRDIAEHGAFNISKEVGCIIGRKR